MPFARNLLTDGIIAALEADGIHAGDHEAPLTGGWSTGQPGVDEFIAYAVVFAQGTSYTSSTLCPGDYDVRASYELRCYGATREQADDLALRASDAVRSADLPDPGSYKVRRMSMVQLSSMERMDSTSPKTWRASAVVAADCVPTSSP